MMLSSVCVSIRIHMASFCLVKYILFWFYRKFAFGPAFNVLLIQVEMLCILPCLGLVYNHTERLAWRIGVNPEWCAPVRLQTNSLIIYVQWFVTSTPKSTLLKLRYTGWISWDWHSRRHTAVIFTSCASDVVNWYSAICMQFVTQFRKSLVQNHKTKYKNICKTYR